MGGVLNHMTFIDFFAGIGGFTAGLTQAGMSCVGFCENDKYAIKSYNAIHNPKEKEWFRDDITKIESSDIPYADGWTAGFPCQDISISGKNQTGLNGQRSGLFFEIIRLVKGKNPEDKPRWLLLENVKNLLGINSGADFTEILYQLSEAGYDCQWQVINSKSYVPQNRERVFIAGFIRNGSPRKIFPIGVTNTKTPVELIGGCQGNRVYDPSGIGITLTSVGGGGGARTGLYCVGVNRKDGIVGEIDCAHTLTASDFRGLNRNQTQNAVVEYGEENLCFIDLCKKSQRTEIARCLKARYNSGITNHQGENTGGLLKIRQATKKGYAEARPGDGINIAFPNSDSRRGRVCKKTSQTLTTSGTQATLTGFGRIRKLTPLECFRLQGFSDEMFNKARAVNSDNQLYRQIGNSVTVPVIYEIGKKIMEVYDGEIY